MEMADEGSSISQRFFTIPGPLQVWQKIFQFHRIVKEMHFLSFYPTHRPFPRQVSYNDGQNDK